MAKVASRCCELANPAQVRQIASQTGVLLCRMRFVAGRGADKACCWQRRCGEAVAGRGPSAQRTAGRGAAAKSHQEELLAGAPWQSCRPGAPWKRVGSGHGNKLRQGKQSAGRDAPSGRRCRQGRCSEEPSGSKQGKSPCCKQGKSSRCKQGKSPHAANKKESGKTHSLKPALVMTALVRVTGARPRGSSQLLLCSLELLW